MFTDVVKDLEQISNISSYLNFINAPTLFALFIAMYLLMFTIIVLILIMLFVYCFKREIIKTISKQDL